MTGRVILIRLTIYLLRTSSGPLSAVGYSRATDCPSWVPDWTNIDRSAIKELSDTAARSNCSPCPSNSVPPGARKQPRRTEPSIEELTEYQEPNVLLAQGRVVDRVKGCIQVPKLTDFPEDGPMIAKIWKWESYVIECLQETRDPHTINAAGESLWSTSGPPRGVLRDSLVRNKQLWGLEFDEVHDDAALAFAWYQFLLYYAFPCEEGGLTEKNRWIGIYQARMQEHRRENITARGLKRDGLNYKRVVALLPVKHLPDSRPCGHCENAHSLQTTDQPSDRTLKSDVGQLWILTERGDLLQGKGNMIVQEGDIICGLEDSLEFFVLRKAGETYWTLVGTFIQ